MAHETRYVFSTRDTIRYRIPTHTNELVLDRCEAETAEAFVVILEPGEAPPLHVHHDTEQVFYGLEGTGALQIGDSNAEHYSVVKHICDRVTVMYVGKLVEMASTEELYHLPKHPNTAALMAAVPVADPRINSGNVELKGEAPSPANPPSGCYFHPRCEFVVDFFGPGQPHREHIRRERRGPRDVAAGCRQSIRLPQTAWP